MAGTNTYRAEIKIRMLVEDEDEFDVTEYQSRWGMNEIPACDIVTPAGRNAVTGKIAQIHKKAESLREMKKVKVYQKITGHEFEDEPWNEKETVIFDGYLTGVGTRKMRGQLQPVVGLVHWLADLNFSSTVSQQSFPDNPFYFNYQAAVNSAGAGADGSVGLLMNRARELFVADNCADDLWAKAIKPYLCALTEEDLIRAEGANAGLVDEGGTNKLAQEALKRIDGESDDACSRALSAYAKKLAMTFPQDASTKFAIGSAIADAVTRMAADASTITQRTMWDFLVGVLGPMFWFSVIPLIDNALVVPFTPGLREYHKAVEANEYDMLDLNFNNIRPLRGVGVYKGMADITGFTDASAMDAEPLTVAHFSPEGSTTGMTRFVAPPTWLSYVPASIESAANTTGVANKQPINMAIGPVAANADGIAGDKNGAMAHKVNKELSDVYKRYAQVMYMNAQLEGRMATLSGRLRFDISPGSTVRINGSKDAFIGSDDDINTDYVGTVARMSIGINAQTAACGTGLQLAHIRTIAENEDDKYSVAAHPLYGPDSIYKGSPLTEAYN